MNKTTLRSITVVAVLILTMLAALVWARQDKSQPPTAQIPLPSSAAVSNSLLSMQAQLSQSKIAQNSDGLVSMALTISAFDDPNAAAASQNKQDTPVDMVIVLDRSGSMQGSKMQNAKAAILSLADKLSESDRLALVSYSNGVTLHNGLSRMTSRSRDGLRRTVDSIVAQGGTNLGLGLAKGIAICEDARQPGRNVRLLLLSDGHANQGIVALPELGAMARAALRGEFTISTVGVGVDFNEQLMTAIADRGQGSYSFMENPTAFASVFQQELGSARMMAASGLEIWLPLQQGATLVEAGGYPIEHSPDGAGFYPGNIQYGQTRTIYVTLRLPVEHTGEIALPSPILRYRVGDAPREIRLDMPLSVLCVADEKEAVASLDQDVWSSKVVQEDYNRLKEEVALDVAQGNETQALARIREYKEQKSSLNAVVGSEQVQENLEKDVEALRDEVRQIQTAPEPAMLRKQASKKIQHEGYLSRRAKGSVQ